MPEAHCYAQGWAEGTVCSKARGSAHGSKPFPSPSWPYDSGQGAVLPAAFFVHNRDFSATTGNKTCVWSPLTWKRSGQAQQLSLV